MLNTFVYYGSWKSPQYAKGARRSHSSSSYRQLSRTDIEDTNAPNNAQQSKVIDVSIGQYTTDESRMVTQPEQATAQPEKKASSPKFWSHRMYKTEAGKVIPVHYCKSLKTTEKIVQHFMHDKILGFDMEWKAQATSGDSIQDNVSLIQLASPNRIALFQISQFKPAKGLKDLVSPSLRQILESPDVTKVGVAIKADCTRLRKYLGIDTRSIFELSHLYKLVKYCLSNPSLVNKRPVSLSEQVEEHFGLPLQKVEDIRCSDWTSALKYRQVQYAAADPYACIRLFDVMDTKRKALDLPPPLPAHADSNLPIQIVGDIVLDPDSDDVEVLNPRMGSNELSTQSSHGKP